MEKKNIYLCAINNIQSGRCDQDCKFCTQSGHYGAEIDRYNYKSIEQIVNEAQKAIKYGAIGYCLVTSGKGLDDKKTEFIAEVASILKSRYPTLHIIACNGTADEYQLKHLKSSGVDSYNHNLETSREFYPQICSTHSWDERYATCEAVKRVGLMLCCGGIFGMGESIDDRESLIKSIVSLNPEASPLNFFIPNPSLPIKECSISREEGLSIISNVRERLGSNALVMVAGGREMLFSGYEKQMFDSGANSIVIGDYLTVSGASANSDIDMIASIGYSIAKSCNA